MSADNWLASVEFTLTEEGGLSDDPGDPGGLTKFGISQRAYPDVDIRNLTREGAIEIYHSDYWNPVRGDELPPGVDLMVFDMGVNAGVARSVKILQRCIGVNDDGVIGGETRDAAAAADRVKLISALGAAQLAYYEALPGWAEFGKGWGGRVSRRQTAALAREIVG